MSSSIEKISDAVLDVYLKIMVFVIWQERSDTDLSDEQMEERRHQFHELLVTLTGAEMVDLGKRIMGWAPRNLRNHRDQKRIVVLLLQEVLGARLSRKYLGKHPGLLISDPREPIEYTEADATALRNMLMSLRSEAPEEVGFKLDALMEEIT